MELHNYEPGDWRLENEFDDPTVALFDDSGFFEFDSVPAHPPCVRMVVASNEAKKDESKIQSIVQTASR
jgi:hypothetical protein